MQPRVGTADLARQGANGVPEVQVALLEQAEDPPQARQAVSHSINWDLEGQTFLIAS